MVFSNSNLLNRGSLPRRHQEAPLSAHSAGAVRSSNSPETIRIRHLTGLVSLLVVFLHAGGQPKPDMQDSRILAAYFAFNGVLTLVRMPLFFFVSGYVFMHTNPPGLAFDAKHLVWKKVLRLLLPYLFISTVAFFVKVPLNAHALRSVSVSPGGFAMSLISPEQNAIAFFWFIPALFLIFLIAPLLRTLLLSNDGYIIALVTIGLLEIRFNSKGMPELFGLVFAMKFAFFFWVGMLGWRWRELWTRNPNLIFAILGLLPAAAYYLSGSSITHIKFLIGTLGIYALYCCADLYTRRGWTFLSRIERSTYQIYLLAWFPQQFGVVILYKMLNFNYWVCWAVMFFGGVGVPLLVTQLVSRYTPALCPLLGINRDPLTPRKSDAMPSSILADVPVPQEMTSTGALNVT